MVDPACPDASPQARPAARRRQWPDKSAVNVSSSEAGKRLARSSSNRPPGDERLAKIALQQIADIDEELLRPAACPAPARRGSVRSTARPPPPRRNRPPDRRAARGSARKLITTTPKTTGRACANATASRAAGGVDASIASGARDWSNVRNRAGGGTRTRSLAAPLHGHVQRRLVERDARQRRRTRSRSCA